MQAAFRMSSYPPNECLSMSALGLSRPVALVAIPAEGPTFEKHLPHGGTCIGREASRFKGRWMLAAPEFTAWSCKRNTVFRSAAAHQLFELLAGCCLSQIRTARPRRFSLRAYTYDRFTGRLVVAREVRYRDASFDLFWSASACCAAVNEERRPNEHARPCRQGARPWRVQCR